jgi:hypothetical protein
VDTLIGPRISALTALNQFIPLPNVENTWSQLPLRTMRYRCGSNAPAAT